MKYECLTEINAEINDMNKLLWYLEKNSADWFEVRETINDLEFKRVLMKRLNEISNAIDELYRRSLRNPRYNPQPQQNYDSGLKSFTETRFFQALMHSYYEIIRNINIEKSMCECLPNL